jgi:SRSO17 transposase
LVVVKTSTIAALAAAHSIDPQRWLDEFGALLDRIAPRFARFEPLRHAGALMTGLLSDIARKNCWTLAEQRGQGSPYGLQHLLSRAKWDADAVRDDVRDYVTDAFGDPGGILVVDETGDVKKGSATVGVQRQYTGTAGRIENAQVAVYLTYVGSRGHALIDRALYLPKGWAADDARRQRAGVPEQAAFATKPTLAKDMVLAALDAGVPAAWVAGDEVYGNDPKLAAALRERRIGYVLAVACDHRVPTEFGPVAARSLAEGLAPRSWRLRSAGFGAKGPRMYSWTCVPIPSADPGHHALLVRRNDTTGELAFYRCWTEHPATLGELVHVAGNRWRIEKSFQTTKGQAGLDEHQVRTWTSWHRWVTLAMLAMAFLAVSTAAERDRSPTPAGLIPMTLNEFRRLFDSLALSVAGTLEHTLAWSTWRRKHQATARHHHYHRRSQHQ